MDNNELSTNLAEVGTDCISRQAAIEALHTILMYRMGTDSNKKRLDDWINSLPPIQPKRGEVDKNGKMGKGLLLRPVPKLS